MSVQWPKKSPKWYPKPSKSHQNELQTGSWSHQNCGSPEKVKSHENVCIYHIFKRWGHQKSSDFQFKNHQKECLRSKCDFGHFKSDEISKSDPEWSPMGDPKSMENRWNSTLEHSRSRLSEPLQPVVIKLVLRWCPRTPKCAKNDPPRPRRINKSERKPTGTNWQLLKQNESNLLGKMFLITKLSTAFNSVNLRNPADPSNLQISGQLVARGAGGRGGAFG